MLVLSRKINEEVVIDVGGVKIVVTVADIDRNKARLGFTAPQEVKIHRREVQDAIDQGKPYVPAVRRNL